MRPSLLAVTLICGLGLATLARTDSVESADAAAVAGADAATGERLAALLRAGRSVISNNQALINDPTIGEKHLSGDRLVREAIAIYIERQGKPPIDDTMSAQERRIVAAQIAAMQEVIDEQQGLIDTQGLGFKGLIPAVFGRLVNERFAEKVGSEARVKVTAPLDLVRNRTARPDAWERAVIEDRFQSADWPKGAPFSALVDSDGPRAFRMLIPEYYSASCLSCHGQPKGETDITGYPREGGKEGDLAGAISITLFK